MGIIRKEKAVNIDPSKLDMETQFLYLKHHMKFLNDNQKKRVTMGMPKKYLKALGMEEEAPQKK